MEIQSNKAIVDFRGDEIKQPIYAGEEIVGEKTLTVGDVCIDALVIPIKADAEPRPGAAVQIFKLAQIFQSEKVELSIEQTALLKHRVECAGRFSPWVVGQVLQVLDS